jgi:uncharacterized FlaG/YvyC family protein
MKSLTGISGGVAPQPPAGAEPTGKTPQVPVVSEEHAQHNDDIASTAQSSPPSVEDMESAVTELQQTLSRLPGSNREARLRFEDQDQSYVVEILDLDSGKVIQQYPPEKLLNQSPRPADLLGTVIDRRS